jgi:thiamine thiazole synthase
MDEVLISQAIIESYFQDLKENLELDVAIAGAGPSGLIAGYYLAKEGCKVGIFERHLKPGGGMPGGGMMFNRIVIQEEAKSILGEIGVRLYKYESIYTADSVETISALCLAAIKAGAKIFNLITVEDLVVKENRVSGVVLNWSAVALAKLHVDPLAVSSQFVIDATGHDSELCRILERKNGQILNTPDGKVRGEKSMWAEMGEKDLIKNSQEVYPGLYICGMAANAVFGSPRMGAIFGGMLLSGKKVAEEITNRIKKRR